MVDYLIVFGVATGGCVLDLSEWLLLLLQEWWGQQGRSIMPTRLLPPFSSNRSPFPAKLFIWIAISMRLRGFSLAELCTGPRLRLKRKANLKPSITGFSSSTSLGKRFSSVYVSVIVRRRQTIRVLNWFKFWISWKGFVFSSSWNRVEGNKFCWWLKLPIEYQNHASFMFPILWSSATQLVTVRHFGASSWSSSLNMYLQSNCLNTYNIILK